MCEKKTANISCISIIFTTFVMPEGRNPRVKNAFLALSRISKSPISKQGMRTMQRSFCLCICRGVYSLPWAVHFYPYMRQRGVFVSQFISAKAFGDA